MAQASQLSPELARELLQLARSLLAAARNWTLYPPEHPAVGGSVRRLADAIQRTSLGAAFSIGVTPDTLLVEGAAADPSQAGIAEAAALLHDRDLIRVTFQGSVPPEALPPFLRLLALDAAERRNLGGPARVWATEGHPSIVLEQVDYEKVLAREEGEQAEPARRDELWRSIVMSLSGSRMPVFDARAQERLLAIAGSPTDIADLSIAATASSCTPDGSPMITSQAAIILATFRHLMSIVSVMSPDRVADVMNNMATAACDLNPHVVVQMLGTEDDPTDGVAMASKLSGAFDDVKVAQLLATALALEGKASSRLAAIFNTIAPDESRKRRVLTMTRSLLSETDFGQSHQFHALWASAEELLVSYNETPFVSDTYRSALDGMAERAERMAGGADLPPEMAAWLDSLGQHNVRALSVTMLIDLFSLENDETRASEIATDMEALAEDLLLSGAYDDTLRVTRALAARANGPAAVGREGARVALHKLGQSPAMYDTVTLIGEIDDEGWAAIRTVLDVVGVSSVEALTALVMSEEPSAAAARAEQVVVHFGSAAVPRLAGLTADSRWFVQRNAARLLGRIGSPDAVPLLQPLLRQSDPRVVREAVTSLSRIKDPSAARAIQTVLRASTGAVRRAVIDTLVEDRDPRVVPILVQIVKESEPLGADHQVVLEMAAALAQVGSEEAVPTLADLAHRRAWFGRKRMRALKQACVEALRQIGGARAQTALDDARRTGDRMLRKIIGTQAS